MFYVYWYMPWHEKPVHDCCGRPFDNSCSHECVYKVRVVIIFMYPPMCPSPAPLSPPARLQCKEDCYRCPEDCEKCCPGCMGGTEPLSVRARHPEWNKAHMAMPPCGEPATKQPSLQLTERPFSWGVPPMAPTPPGSDFVPPPKLTGVSPLSPGAAVYGGPTIGGPTMGGPTIGGPTIGGPSLAPLAAAPPPKSATASPKAAPKKQKASK